MTDLRAASADRLVGAVQRFISGANIDLLTALANATSVLSEVATDAQLHQLDVDVELVIDRYTRSREYLDERAVAISQQYAWLPVRFTLDAILATFDKQHELQQAAADLSAIEQTYADARRQLEEAMAAGDVDAVMDQRRAVTITLPEQVDAARVHLLDLQTQRTVVEIGELDARLATFQADVDTTERHHQDVYIALVEALDAMNQAKNLHQEATTARNQHGCELEQQRQHLADLTAEVEADHRQRIRQLAGI